MTVELTYDRNCPNVQAARANLVKALAASRREARWTEWDRGAPDSPPRVMGYGSPTILVGGKEVGGGSASEGGGSCRLYGKGAGRFTGEPSVEQIVASLPSQEGAALVVRAGWKSSMAAVPGIVFAFLPSVFCPACWPAYAGVLSSLGLGFLLDRSYLLRLTAASLMLAVGALAFKARRRRGYGPFAAGLAAALVVLVGKFLMESNPAMYGGIAGLVAASIWNAWPVRGFGAECPACTRDSSSDVSLTSQKER